MSPGGAHVRRNSPHRRPGATGLIGLGLVLVATAAIGWSGSRPALARSAVTETRPAHATRSIPPVRPTRVLVLGDSVMKGADARYGSELPGREVVVDTEVSRSTGAGADVLATRGTDWDAVVILLGHNDGAAPGVYQPAARRILDQLRDVRRVSWLTLHEVRPYYPAVNQYLAGLRAEYPNLHLADWNAVARANPGAVAGDGLHLTPRGAELMADLVARQVEETEFEFAVALNRLAASATTTTAPTTTQAPTTTVATTLDPERSEDELDGTGAAPGDPEPGPAAPKVAADDGGGSADDAARGSTTSVLAAGSVAALAVAIVVVATRRRRHRSRDRA
jgi:lysophospholipase L1-like esterase